MILEIIIVLDVILLSMTIHEAMHAFMGYVLGDNTAKEEGRLTLNPIRHIDPVMTILLPLIMVILHAPVFGGAKPVPFNPNRVRFDDWGAALVALSGPITNLVIAFIAFGVGVFSGVINNAGTVQPTIFGLIISTAVSVNLGFFVFNMLPIPPLDGSRVLYAVAPDGVRGVMQKIEQNGVLLVMIIVVLFSDVIGQVMSGCIRAILRVFMNIFGV
ncbi:site-2 protease family protein [Candidatus Minimicrobia naudis]|uniref:Site-2 protease family protein n=1 Tax=Candidatus Minimicrobia naudis TaxID=2841263 RepID=A0A8F1MCL0_9BACT|nr:site-2 protease family protein [Candidatus Minimicrobia naudis]